MIDVLTVSKIADARAAEALEASAGMMDQRTFHAFHQRTAAPLRAYVAHVLGSVTEADDIVQDAYLRFLRKPPPTNDPQHLRAFLFRIASNLITDHWRARRREHRSSLETDALTGAAAADVPLRVDMARVFARLTPRQRQLMWMAYVEGAEHREIAAALGLHERSVRVLLHRVRRKLASMLRPGGHGER